MRFKYRYIYTILTLHCMYGDVRSFCFLNKLLSISLCLMCSEKKYFTRNFSRLESYVSIFMCHFNALTSTEANYAVRQVKDRFESSCTSLVLFQNALSVHSEAMSLPESGHHSDIRGLTTSSHLCLYAGHTPHLLFRLILFQQSADMSRGYGR